MMIFYLELDKVPSIVEFGLRIVFNPNRRLPFIWKEPPPNGLT
jgi:hypothetical protein